MRLFDIEDRAAPPPPPTVRVNGCEITRVAIAREVQNHPADDPGDAREEAVRALVVRELLLQEARNRGLAPNPIELGAGQRETDEDAIVRQLLDIALNLPTPTEDECRRFYKANIARFRSPTIWEPSHILLSAAAVNVDQREAAKKTAVEIIEALKQEPGRFAQLAHDYSACPSRDQGGNLGQVSSGQTTPAFEAALEDMETGSFSIAPVETPYGFHVIRLDRRIAGQALPFASVKQKISDYLADAVFHRAVRQYVSVLAGAAQIEGIEFDRALSPLVQ